MAMQHWKRQKVSSQTKYSSKQEPRTFCGQYLDVYVLELYSGRGSVSEIASTVLGECPVITVDEGDSHGRPTIQATLPEENDSVIEQCRSLFPSRRPVIWGSPDCRHYSRANTRGRRDLEAADACVEAVSTIASALDAVAVIVENPATGLLVDRPVVNFLSFRNEVHYCMYGKLYRKATMLWTSHDLLLHGFEPRTCNGNCDACIVKLGCKRHIRKLTDFDLTERVSVPDGLVASVFKAVRQLLVTLRTQDQPTVGKEEERAARRKNDMQINLILDSRLRKRVVQVKVEWVGRDQRSWIDAADLPGGIASQHFLSVHVRSSCMNLVKKYSPSALP